MSNWEVMIAHSMGDFFEPTHSGRSKEQAAMPIRHLSCPPRSQIHYYVYVF
jgi:hypothetical protein